MKLIFLFLLSTAPFINSQQHFREPNRRVHFGEVANRRIQSGGSNQATRLGLLGPQIGVAPVPGGNNFFGSPNTAGNNFGGGGPRGCFCLPKNQVCNPSGPIPGGSTRILKNTVDTRIINTNPASRCPEDEIECCFGSEGRQPSIPSLPARDQTACGVNRRLFPGTARDAQAEFGEYPWMAAILKGTSDFVAGGVIVSPNTIVTAAHKVTDPALYKVRVGDYDLSVPNEVPELPHQEIRVSQVIYHPQFNPTNLANDVAILKLAQPIRYAAHINAACLPESRQRFTGSRCYLSGWGKNKEGRFQPILREVDLPIVDEYVCEERLRTTKLTSNFILNKQSFLCAGGEFGKDACSGDGGSPLVCKESNRGSWTVIGLVAWGIGCGNFEIPGVYVNLPTYSNFIKQYL